MNSELSKTELSTFGGTRRVYSLDALRGFAILTMILSGSIPFGVLPNWMYHAQVPPPEHVFNPNLPGLTWVDLVFPMFLFAMGVSMPLALSRRIEKGYKTHQTFWYILERGFLLGFFAIYVMHIRPYVISDPVNAGANILALVGFALLFPIYSRLPKTWGKWTKRGVKLGGWLGAIVLMASLDFASGNGFSVYKNDIIIVVLANMAVFGAFAWLLTRNRLLLRLGILGVLIAIRLAHSEPGWVSWLWDATPAPWIYKLYYLQYLFIVLSGTIAGEVLLRWMKSDESIQSEKNAWSQLRLVWIILLMFGIVLFLLIGLQARWLPYTTFIAFGLSLVGWWLVRKPANNTEEMLRTLFLWGVYWLVLGLFFEPFEGGIKKDHPTMSYYFVTTGASIFVLIAFTIIIDIFRKKRWMQLLIDNGQNPMIAYAGIQSLMRPILALTGIGTLLEAITPTPWLGALRGLFITLLLAWIVSLFTKMKIFWRT